MQFPIFKKLGLDLTEYYPGTLNIDIAPLQWKPLLIDYTFELVEWTDLHPPETFSFLQCQVSYEDRWLEAWIYYPHPETKETHFQNPSIVEIITKKIIGLEYGSTIEIGIEDTKIQVVKPE